MLKRKLNSTLRSHDHSGKSTKISLTADKRVTELAYWVLMVKQIGDEMTTAGTGRAFAVEVTPWSFLSLPGL